ncbi:putative Thaumatin family [Dioscorea sansibarensis]
MAAPGGGGKLDDGQTWTTNINAGTTSGRVWARTGCNFSKCGHGCCETGDCNGLLQCQAYGKPPNTLAEFALSQFNNIDFFDISLVDGFNVPMTFTTEGGCQTRIECTDHMNSECPAQLKVPGGSKTDECYCNSGSCSPNICTRFYRGFRLAAYGYPKDDKLSLYTCPAGTNYRVLFCPTASY